MLRVRLNRLLMLIAAVWFCNKANAQAFVPVATTGYNFDAIAETFPFGAVGTTATMDLSNNVMYSQAFGVSAGIGGGVINSGTIVSAGNTYQLRPFNATNALHLTAGSGTLTLTTPSNYDQLSILAFATEGNSNFSVTVNFTDATTASFGPFFLNDWFFGAGAAYAGFGRINRVNAAPYNVSGLPTDPRMYPFNITLACADKQKNIGSITITHNSGNHTFVMAVSGNKPPVITATGGNTCLGGSVNLTSSTTIAGGTYLWTPGGATGSTTTVNPAVSTTYTLNYTYNGCVYTDTARVNIVPGPTVNVAGATICNGGSTTLTASGATTYSWAPGTGLSATTGTSVTANPTTTTTYTITGTTAGCTGSTTATVTVNPLPVMTSINTASICSGGTVNIPLTADIPSTFLWIAANNANTTGESTTAQGTSTLNNAITNTAATAQTVVYTVTPTSNPAGCVGNPQTVNVTVNPLPTVTVNNAAICSGSSAVLNANGASTYSWSPGTNLSATTGSSVTANPPSTTSYTVTGTDGNGCINTATATVTINSSFDATVSPAGPYCQSDPVATMTAVDPGGTWSGTCGTCIDNATGVFDPSLAGIGNHTITYTIPGACGATDSEVITVNPPADASFVFPATICAEANPIALTPTIAGGTWSATCGSCINAVSGVFDPAAATVGINTITYTTAGGCAASQSNDIIVEQQLIAAINTTDALCNGSADGTITIVSAGATQFSSDGGTSFQAGNVFTVAAGTYTIEVQNANGCIATGSATVNEPTIVSVAASILVPETCAGSCDGQLQATPAGGTAGYTITWSGTATGSGTTLINACSGNYTATVTDNNGCTASGNVLLVSPSTISITSITPTSTLCDGSADGSITIVASASVTQYSIDNGATFQPGNTFTNVPAGSYTIVVEDAGGCQATGSVNVAEPEPLVAIALANVTICAGQSTTLTVMGAGGTPPYSAVWDDPASTSALSVLVTPGASTTFTATLTDANGCGPITDAVFVTVNPAVTVIASADVTICPGGVAIISAEASGGNGGPYVYTWTNSADGTILTGAMQNVSPAAATTYTVTATDNCTSIPATDQVNVSLYALPAVTYTIDTNQGCLPVTVNFINTSDTTVITNATWNFGDGSTATGNNATHVFGVAGCYSISLNMTTDDGCSVDTTINNQVCVYVIPDADFGFTPQPTDIYNPEISFTNLTTGGAFYSWNFGGLGTSSNSNPSFVFPSDSAGIYTVCLHVVSSNGCIDSVCHDVEILGDFLVYVPNAFTPNGDGYNDVFLPMIQGEATDSYEIMVFNRWGEIIFKSTDKLTGWDGTSKSQKSKEDVYVWKIKVKKDGVEDIREYYGHVTLLR